ncbi:unnamed protein product [Cyprideis torosa]|uniref:Uncharacterized protein n=1 Tax=Cyprideis torosa TaxID=163714 RepID=A0A7R8ZJH6_9CRUS|nr:unnamed protein product [Cyprideis torosa]CAG0882279.1 unnamed protein product [Cyprideis torosa]
MTRPKPLDPVARGGAEVVKNEKQKQEGSDVKKPPMKKSGVGKKKGARSRSRLKVCRPSFKKRGRKPTELESAISRRVFYHTTTELFGAVIGFEAQPQGTKEEPSASDLWGIATIPIG